jgi:hypothetical protein
MIENIETGRMRIKETDRGFSIINEQVKKPVGRPRGSKNQKKAIDETGKKSGIFNLVNITGTPQKQIYDPVDNSGVFPKTEFNVNPIVQTIPDDVKAGYVEEEVDEPVIVEKVPIENLKDASLSIEPVQSKPVKQKTVKKTVKQEIVDTSTPVQQVVVDTSTQVKQKTVKTNTDKPKTVTEKIKNMLN